MFYDDFVTIIYLYMLKEIVYPFIKLRSIVLLVLLFAGNANAQLIDRVFENFDNHQNISYAASLKIKDFFSDKVLFDTLQATETLHSTTSFWLKGNVHEDIFDGRKAFKLNHRDSSYQISDKASQCHYYDKSLSYLIEKMRKYIKKGAEVTQSEDSVFLGKSYFQLRIKDLDSTIKGKKIFSVNRLLIDKKTYLPVFYRNDSEGFIDGTNIFLKIFNEYHFSDIKVDLPNLTDLSQIILPNYFMLEKPKVPMVLLARGTPAPELEITDLNGKIRQLTAYKGKLILLNFTGNGCPHCVEAIDMLNDLAQKYKDNNVEILSINFFDDKASILKFNKRYEQHYPTFTSAKNTQQKYQINGYPTFYLINTKGEIIKGYLGFSKQIGEQIDEQIATLIQ
jgi:thiol-disulfide isomerase/thioredoxin